MLGIHKTVYVCMYLARLYAALSESGGQTPSHGGLTLLKREINTIQNKHTKLKTIKMTTSKKRAVRKGRFKAGL